jgi:hypothetical protein
VESADAAPTTQAASAYSTYVKLLDLQLAKWETLKAKDLPALNVLLQQQGLPAITVK